MSARPTIVRLLLALLAASAPGCSTEERAPNMVVVLVDQLRKDWADEWMPETMALARQGVVFEGMRAAAPWTYPSVVSMFSGLYPQQHGADGPPLKSTLLSTFADDVPMLPALLTDRYHTAGFVTNPFFQSWNPFHLGFDHYAIDEFVDNVGPRRGTIAWTPDMFSDSVNASVLEHFGARPYGRDGEPEFTYVHYIDVHGPWEGAPFEAGDAIEKETAIDVRETSTRYVDLRIVELYDFFNERYDGDLVFVVTSDHGMEEPGDLELESSASTGLGSSLRQRKATVHDFNTHIPFLVLPSRHVPGPRTVGGACSNIDICATLLDWAGVAAPPGLPAVSLLPAIRGEPLTERPVYSLMSAFRRRNDCAIIGDKKYFRHFDPRTRRIHARFVYDLAEDPAESSPVARALGEQGRVLQELSGTAGIEFEKNFIEVGDEVVGNLQNLGYLGGGEEDDEEDEDPDG